MDTPLATFKVTTEGTDKLGLRAVLERYANDQWLPDYYDDEQRAVSVLDQLDFDDAEPRDDYC